MVYLVRFCIIFILACSQAFASKNTRETIISYPIFGNSGIELQKQMNQHGIKKEGHAFNASTQWFVTWNYRYQSTQQACYLTKVDLDVKIIYLLPKWMNASNSNPDLQRRWNICYRDLYQHEKGHGQNGIKAAKAIEKALYQIPGQKDCAALHTIIKKTANSLIKRYQMKDDQYDAVTQHGRKSS